MGQGHHDEPRPLSLETPDGHGGWRTVKNNLVFPQDAQDLPHRPDRSFRRGFAAQTGLRTNLEVYWMRSNGPLVRRTRRFASRNSLRYGGFALSRLSVIRQANQSSPEIPDYDQLAATTQIWRDLSGYYTRYGDVRELLSKRTIASDHECRR